MVMVLADPSLRHPKLFLNGFPHVEDFVFFVFSRVGSLAAVSLTILQPEL